MIHLEPREKYDVAILEEDYECNVVIYSYDSLVDILVQDIATHYPDENSQELYHMAVEHIDYNIEGMRVNYKDWPLFLAEEEYEEYKKNHMKEVVRN
tara:strand:- start:21 stop:311 length:291 start_codon:yes stop_codon:yes gene_type:complete